MHEKQVISRLFIKKNVEKVKRTCGKIEDNLQEKKNTIQ